MVRYKTSIGVNTVRNSNTIVVYCLMILCQDKIGAVKPIKSTGTSACEICKKEYSYIQFNTAHYCEACGKVSLM